MGKINIAELLKDCPKGMELDCIKFDGIVTFEGVTDCDYYPIKISIKYGNESFRQTLTRYGQTCITTYDKCVIFPKGKTTWEGFQRPFKDGDVVYIQSLYEYIAIYKETNCGNLHKHAVICISFNNRFLQDNNILCCEEDVKQIRLATEEEKQKLFDTIKANGYKWNPETKTLEKLIEPKFKVGDKIKNKKDYISGIITDISDGTYKVEYKSGGVAYANIKYQDDWELVPNKFDITTLKPFESKVLVRTNNRKWVAAFYSHYDKDSLLKHCVVGGLWYEQCIPYESNEHLLDTTNNCDEYYKTW